MTGLDLDGDGAVARFDGGRAVRARWVVGADGMHSRVRELAGIGFGGPADPGSRSCSPTSTWTARSRATR